MREALREDPASVEARINHGGVYLQMGRIRDAGQWYRKPLQVSPRDVRAHYNLGLCLKMQQRIPEAIEHFEFVCLLASGNRVAMFELAVPRLSECQPRSDPWER